MYPPSDAAHFCRSDRHPQDALSDSVYSFTVGSPVSNCMPGSSSDATNAIGGSITLEDSWSVGTSIGWNLGGLQVDAFGGWSRSEAKSFSQTVTITIKPGEMVRLRSFSSHPD